MTPRDLPTVDAMLVREFVPTGTLTNAFFGGVLVLDAFDVRDVGRADMRLDYDEAAVDCSNRMFQITTWMMVDDAAPDAVACFPSRRWRNLRTGEDITSYPSRDTPLQYLGNPVRVIRTEGGLHVFGRGEFVIKSGVELGY